MLKLLLSILKPIVCSSENLRIHELEGRIESLNRQIAELSYIPPNYEFPSPSDIVPKSNIKVSNLYNASQVTIDYTTLNIPFTKYPRILYIMDIPDTNSMDGLMDYGHNPLYIEPADEENHTLLCDWLAYEFESSNQLLANDCVYRIMVDETDPPSDFTKPYLFYAIHRIHQIFYKDGVRYWVFKGINPAIKTVDPYIAQDKNILWLNTGVIW